MVLEFLCFINISKFEKNYKMPTRFLRTIMCAFCILKKFDHCNQYYHIFIRMTGIGSRVIYKSLGGKHSASSGFWESTGFRCSLIILRILVIRFYIDRRWFHENAATAILRNLHFWILCTIWQTLIRSKIREKEYLLKNQNNASRWRRCEIRWNLRRIDFYFKNRFLRRENFSEDKL